MHSFMKYTLSCLVSWNPKPIFFLCSTFHKLSLHVHCFVIRVLKFLVGRTAWGKIFPFQLQIQITLLSFSYIICVNFSEICRDSKFGFFNVLWLIFKGYFTVLKDNNITVCCTLPNCQPLYTITKKQPLFIQFQLSMVSDNHI